jgi:hypothetical protein
VFWLGMLTGFVIVGVAVLGLLILAWVQRSRS